MRTSRHHLIYPTAKGSDEGWEEGREGEGMLNVKVYQSEEGPDSKV